MHFLRNIVDILCHEAGVINMDTRGEQSQTTLHTELTTINEMPSKSDLNGRQLTIGDLHGNTMKLVMYLVKYGILQINEEEYIKLNQLYNKVLRGEENSYQNIKEFVSIIQNSYVNKDINMLRLIGDELSDRGANDYMTLAVLSHLKNNKVPLEIIYSNHSEWFFQFMSTGVVPKVTSKNMQGRSLINFSNILEDLKKDGVDKDQLVWKIYDESTFKLASYAIDETGRLTIFTHAPYDLECLKQLANAMNVAWDGASNATIAESIDRINQKFYILMTGESKEVKKELEKILKNEKDSIDAYERGGEDAFKNGNPAKWPFNAIIWNRNVKNLACENNSGITFVHGHNDKSPKGDNVKGIDDKFGKGIMDVRIVEYKSKDQKMQPGDIFYQIKKANIENKVSISYFYYAYKEGSKDPQQFRGEVAIEQRSSEADIRRAIFNQEKINGNPGEQLTCMPANFLVTDGRSLKSAYLQKNEFATEEKELIGIEGGKTSSVGETLDISLKENSAASENISEMLTDLLPPAQAGKAKNPYQLSEDKVEEKDLSSITQRRRSPPLSPQPLKRGLATHSLFPVENKETAEIKGSSKITSFIAKFGKT